MEPLQEEYLRLVTHALRTPLTGLLGTLSLLKCTSLNPEQEQYTEIARLCGESFLSRVNDLFEFSQLQQGRQIELSLKPFHLPTLLDDVTGVAELLRMENPIEFQLEITPGTPCALESDTVRLYQILIHLIDNAFKFTRRGYVRLSVNYAEDTENDTLISFTVQDSGPGIQKAQLQSLFKPAPLENLSSPLLQQGLGIGLCVVRRLVEGMGGVLSVDSKRGKGTKVQFSIRCKKTEDIRYPWTYPSGLEGMNVLVLDKTISHLSPLIGWLREGGINPEITRETSSVSDLLKGSFFQENPFHILLVDLDSYGAWLEQLQGNLRDKNLSFPFPIVGMLPFGVPVEDHLFQQWGLSAYVIKPIQRVILFRTLQTVLREFTPASLPSHSFEERLTESEIEGQKRKEEIHVLLVEDNLMNRFMVEALLKKEGYSVDTAGSGHEALKALEVNRYNVMLLDIQMPGLDGFETAREIRKGHSGTLNAAIPIIALTAYMYPAEKKQCLDAGMNDLITKPFHPQELFEKIKYWSS
jgi:CheY-like chemotaxis protein